MIVSGDIPYRKLRDVSPDLLATLHRTLDSVDWKKHQRGNDPLFRETASIEMPYIMCETENDEVHVKAAVDELLTALCFPQHRVVRAYLGYVFPKCKIELHKDTYVYHRLSHRVHLPLFTHEDAKILWEGYEAHLPANAMYEIDNIRRHGVYNGSDQSRLHLIADFCRLDVFRFFKDSMGIQLVGNPMIAPELLRSIDSISGTLCQSSLSRLIEGR